MFLGQTGQEFPDLGLGHIHGAHSSENLAKIKAFDCQKGQGRQHSYPMGKRLGILTSGGDCAGLNAVLRGAVLAAHHLHGWEVWGIEQGTHGLLVDPPEVRLLTPKDCDSRMLRQGGTILGTTNKGNPFAYPMEEGRLVDRSEEIIARWRKLGLDALIGVGGDGSLAILRKLTQQGGIPFIGIPKTIDNDLGHTEFAVGHSTAVEVATAALDNLQPTAASHGRLMILEVMGRDAGHIALSAGIAGGADAILIPEIPVTLECLAKGLARLKERGFALIVVAEACRPLDLGDLPAGPGRIGASLVEALGQKTGWEARAVVLGHLQRGGQPGALDRIIGQLFGVKAVELAAQGQFDRMVAWSGRTVISVPLADAIARYHAVEPHGHLVQMARGLGILFGDEV